MKNICAIIAILLSCVEMYGKMTETSMPFRNISVDQGLPHNTVSAFYKDRNGFLWIGTKEGLARFDGNRLVNFHSLVGDDIWSIDTLNGDTLLMTTVSGVKWFDTASRTVGKIAGAPGIWFSSLCRIDSTTVLAGSEQGLYRIRNHRAERIPIGNMLANSNHVTGIIPDREGNGFWFSTADGLGHLDRNLKPTVYRRDSPGSRDNYYTCLAAANGSIYIGSYNKGLFRFDPGTGTFTHIDTDNANLIMRLDTDGKLLYVGTNGRGMIIIDLTTGETNFAVHKSSNQRSLASNVVTGLLNDENGIFIGTQFGGISYHSKVESRFSFYRTPYFNSTDHSARSLYFYPDGELLLGTRAGIFQLKDKHLIHSIETTDFDSHLSSGIIPYIGEASGRILVCSYGGGVKVYDRRTGQLSSFNDREEYAQNGRIFHFVTDRRGHIWFASHEGIYETDSDGNLLRHITADNSSMRNDATYWLAFDRHGRLWIASKFGLQILDPATGRMTGALPCLPADIDVRYLYADSHGDMWVCSNRGVFCINEKLELVRKFDADGILPENTVTSVIETPRDMIRISTIHNIVNYNIADGSHEVFRKNDGIGTGDFNGNVAVDPQDSIVCWTNEGGLLVASSSGVWDSPQNPLPRITYVQIGDSTRMIPSTTPDLIELTEGESVHLNLSHMDFRYPENEGFEYMLEGEDQDWILMSGDSRISYHALAPGEYTFRFRTPGTEDYVSTQIVVRRHTWKIVLFWIGVVLLCATAVILVYWIRRLYRRIKDRTQIFSVLNRNSRKPDSELEKRQQPEEPAVNPLMTKLLTLVENQNIYMDSKLKLSDVAGMLGCKDAELSRLLNTELSANFTTFINSYRVKAIKKALADGELKRYTVTAIGLRHGYNSKMTFFRAFKAIEGKTPLEYCKEMGFVTNSEE